ncbi:MAG: DNA (cytosine-5-)-methyltransferase [Candidatus Paceibacterota bacterium]|jgi:DNA (cytosine-5)-methyltransferase 1
MARNESKLKVVELFAGVGGFRLGLEGYKGNRKNHHKHFETVWFNQWEPSTKKQHAHETYVRTFGYVDEFTNKDIAQVVDKVPDHDLLVGGFPCQDYSVARNLSASKGIIGKKGVLWWSIYNILKKKGKNAPNYLMLENVDRLLKSPASQRGRDFAIILSTLNELGYVVEWRVVNAAEYGMPQRRRRIFILGYKKGSVIFNKFKGHASVEKWLTKDGLMAKTFPVESVSSLRVENIHTDPVQISTDLDTFKPSLSPFANAGVAFDYKAHTIKVQPKYNGPITTIGKLLLDDKDVPDEFYIPKEDLERWEYLKGAKNESRTAASGFEFIYTEGGMVFPDSLDKPSRTIITGEGGKTPSRFKHVVKTKKGLRRLTPIELERLCMFPDNHTEGHGDSRRAFFMGNALVVGVIDKLAKSLSELHFGKDAKQKK